MTETGVIPCSGNIAAIGITLLPARLHSAICNVGAIVKDKRCSKQFDDNVDDHDDVKCLDIAVIGGGIGGAYTAWKLKDRGLSISVFENSDRIGGRLLSLPLPAAPGTYMEMGGMRFKTSAHPILTKTVTDVGLSIVDFPLGTGKPDETLWYVREKHRLVQDLGTERMPYNLGQRERKSPDELLWDIYQNHVNFSSEKYPSLEEMYSLVTEDGTPLYKMSFGNYLGRFASREAHHYLSDTSGWNYVGGRSESLLAIKDLMSFNTDEAANESITDGPERHKTVDGGMEKVPQELVKQFLQGSKRHRLYLNQKLVRIKKDDKMFHLIFVKTQTVDGITKMTRKKTRICARKIVLAIDRGSVEDIDFDKFRKNPEILKNLNSVFDHSAGKIFLAYNEKWWLTNNEDITHSRSDLPNKQTYDWATGTNGVSVIMASYHDGDFVHYWRELSQFGSPISGSLLGAYAVTDVVKERLEKYLSAIFNYNEEDIPEAVGGGMMLWDNGWNIFKPGFDERKVREMMYKPSPSDDVFIVSNSWARGDFTGWCEGTLEAVEVVLSNYINRSM